MKGTLVKTVVIRIDTVMESNKEARTHKNFVYSESISNQYHIVFGQMESH